MRTHLVAFLLSVGVAAILTPLVRVLSHRLGLFDAPDGERKIHTERIPRTGGIAIVAGFVAPMVALLVYTNTYARELQASGFKVTAFFAGLGAIATLGIYDDLRGATAWTKLAVQFAVGALLWSAGISFDRFTILGLHVDLGMLALPCTMLWVAGIVNAINLVDGLDGLASGVTFFAATTLFLISWMDHDYMLALFAVALAGSTLGFLFHNFNPALIFMGDTGSMSIGYIFAAAALWEASKRNTAMALALPLLAVGLPLIDTAFAFARRMWSGRSPFSSDREHIHHRLLDAGMSHRQSVLVLYAICLLLTVATIIARITDNPLAGLGLLGVAVGVFIAVRLMYVRWARFRAERDAR